MKKLIVLVAAMVMVATSAYAAEWNFYGSARVSTFWNTLDFDTAAPDVDNFALGLQGNSRIGANVKVSDELTGRFEVGNSATTWNTRIIWGEWNFGGGSLGIGQHYTPLCMFYSNQVYDSDSDLLGWGGVYSGRQPMLQLKFGGFKVALTSVNNSVGAGFAGMAVENKMPAIEASYDLKLGIASVSLAGGYQTFDVGNDSVDAYVIALGGGLNFGPAYLNGNIWTGQNASNLMWVDSAGTNTLASYSGTNVLDNDSIGYLVVLGGKINDMFSLELGYAGVSSELDGSVMDQDSESYYGQLTINLAPGVSITPEVGVIDYDGTLQRKNTYYGAKWQINF